MGIPPIRITPKPDPFAAREVQVFETKGKPVLVHEGNKEKKFIV